MRGLRGERRRHPPPLGRLALLLCWVLVVGGSASNGAAGGFHAEEAGVAAAAGSSDSVGGRRAAEGPRLYELNGERRKFPELHRQRANTKAPPKVVHLDRGRGSAAGGNDAEDQEVPLRVRWRANDRQSPPGERGEATAAGDANGEKNEGSSKRPPYRLPSETKEQLRSVLRQAHTVDLKRRIRELVQFHGVHQSASDGDDFPSEGGATGGASSREVQTGDRASRDLLQPGDAAAGGGRSGGRGGSGGGKRRRRAPPRPDTYAAVVQAATSREHHPPQGGTHEQAEERTAAAAADEKGGGGTRRRLGGGSRLLPASHPLSIKFPFEQIVRDYPVNDPFFTRGYFPDLVMEKVEAEFCELPNRIGLVGTNFCNGERGFGCTVTEVLGTTWEGPTLDIIVEGWLCRLLTEELEEDYEVLDITSRVECIPPRVRYTYVPAKFRKRYITNFQFQSPECKKVYCRNPVWDHPFRGDTASGATSQFFVSAGGTRPGFTPLSGVPPVYVSGDECLASVGIDVWSQGADLVFILAGFG